MPTPPLFPVPEELEMISISDTPEELLVYVTSHRSSSLCPQCSMPSTAIHSSYHRHPQDLPCAGRPIRLLFTVRKFFCRNPTCGKGGERLGDKLGMGVSDATVLWSLYLIPLPEVGKVQVVGIDDWSWRRGKRFGTILVNLQTHKIIDLLADREAESVQKWLAKHPEVEIVSRDRGGVYVDGATDGERPRQHRSLIAGTSHANLGDAVEELLIRALQ